MKIRRIAGDILLLIAAAFTICLTVIMLRRIRSVVLRDDYIEVFRYELIACALFLLFALDVRFGLFTLAKPRILKAVGWVLRAAVIAAVAVLLFFFGRIAVGGLVRTEAPAGNALVLGLALEDGQPTDDLLSRVDTAKGYLEESPEALLILTGGNPDASGRTEAAVMRDLLIERGVSEDRLLLEDRAESTKDNFRNTAQLIDPNQPIVLITSDYHMHRAARTAADAGFANVQRLPAPSSRLAYGANVMWEVVMELNELTLKR